MVSFAQLRDAKFDELDSAWRSWRKLVECLEQAEDTYQGRLLRGVRSARWQGKDAEAAMRTLTPVQSRIRVAAAEASAIGSVLNTAQNRFKAAQLKLRTAISAAEDQYLKVGHDGSIDFPDALPPRYANWHEYQQVARRLQGEFQIAVQEATTADTQIAGALRDLGPDILDSKNPQAELHKNTLLATKLAGFDEGNVPPGNVRNPRDAAAWWKSLPEEQRHLLMNAYPQKIGWLDGLPSEDRDEANRSHLANRIQQLESNPSRSKYEQRDLERLRQLDTTLSLYEEGGKDVYLLGVREGPNDHPREPLLPLDDSDSRKAGPDGQAIVAFGNPDTAAHTAVYVPGTTANLDGFPAELDRAARLWDQSDGYAPGQVSTVAWLGYDAPDRISMDAPADSFAEQGGRDLNRFVIGLENAQQAAGQTDSHMTTVGHSYGSTVVGEAAKQGTGLRVDDIVVAGSPGMHVSHAADLGVGEHHVWSETAWDDPVPPLGALGHGGVAVDWRNGHPLVGPVTPTSADFGGNAMTVDTSGHSGYWDRDSKSLDNQARVVTGQYDRVDYVRGEPPR